MFLLLAARVVYVVLGDPTEALMLLGIAVLITGMTLYQENKTERALDRLRDLISVHALTMLSGRGERHDPDEAGCDLRSGIYRWPERRESEARA